MNRRIIAALVFCGTFFFLNTARPAERTGGIGKVTFTKEIAPIFQNRCQECHRPGGIGRMSMLTYKETRPWAKSIKQKVISREMPPFHAAGPLGSFIGDPRLTDKEIKMIARWVDQGAVEGDSADRPPPKNWSSEGWQGGQPDLVLVMPEPYAVTPDGYDDWVVVYLDYVFPEETWIRGIEVRPGNMRVMHHLVVVPIRPGVEPPPGGRILGSQGTPGQTSLGITTGWVPGTAPRLWPEGYGLPVPKGTRFALNLHYAPSDEPASDQTSIGFYFADGLVRKRIREFSMGTRRFEIPAGDPSYSVELTQPVTKNALITDLFVHMHLRGRAYSLRVVGPEGDSRTIFDVPQYDFDWQRTYKPTVPIALRKGEVLKALSTWDNSSANPNNPDPSANVKWGKSTNDEMILGIFNYEVLGENLAIQVRKGKRIATSPADSGGGS